MWWLWLLGSSGTFMLRKSIWPWYREMCNFGKNKMIAPPQKKKDQAIHWIILNPDAYSARILKLRAYKVLVKKNFVIAFLSIP